MNCARCGKEQPFDFKCVQCNAELAQPVYSDKKSLSFYRVTLAILIVLCLYLSIERIPSGPDHREVISTTTPEKDFEEIEESEQTLVEEPVAVETPKEKVIRIPAVTVLLEKSNPQLYQILTGFRSHYSGGIKIWDVQDRIASEIRSSEILLGIGKKAIDILIEERPSSMVLLLSLDEDITELLSRRENFLGIGGKLPLEIEFQIIQKILPFISNYYLVTDEEKKNLSQSEVRKINPKLSLLSSDPIVSSRELELIDSSNILLWIHDLSPEERQEFLSKIPWEKIPILYGLTNSGEKTAVTDGITERISDDEIEKKSPSENKPEPMISLHISPEALGMQGASLLAKIINKGNIKGFSVPPMEAIEVHVHLNRVLESNRENLIYSLKKRAKKAGFKLEIVP